MNNLTADKILSILKQNTKGIALATLIGLATGVAYSTFIYKPTYKSTAKILIKDVQPSNFLTELGGASSMSPLARNGNPSLTQIGIITSDTLSSKVWEDISAKYNIQIPAINGPSALQKAITVENPVGTDIIEITASWAKPEIAQDIAESYKNEYLESNLNSAKQGILQSKTMIEKQLAEAETNLSAIRMQIKDFKETFSTVDIQAEAENAVGQQREMENRYNEILSGALAEGNKSKTLADKLGIDWETAMNSSALGHNENFGNLQMKLGEAKEELAGFSTKYASKHPSMLILNAKVQNIQQQLAAQIKQTIGVNNIQKDQMVISDPVRTGMIEELADSQANYKGMMAQSGVLRRAIGSIKRNLSEMPKKQLVLAELTQRESSWAEIVNTLKTKQVEATIRESEIVNSINVVDNPSLPYKASFPGRTVLTLLFAMLGTLISTFSCISGYMLKGTYDQPEDLEKEVNAPLLGVVPWLEKDLYEEFESSLIHNNNASFYSIAYQKLVTNIRIKGFNQKVNSLVFTSTSFSKNRSTMLMNIALGLSKAGQSVVIVDADFRTPSIQHELVLNGRSNCNLTRLLATVSQEMSMNSNFDWNYLENYVQTVEEHPLLHVISNHNGSSDPYEYINTPAFSVLIKELKKKFEWVLIDAPPVAAVPDAVNIGSFADGVVLSVNLNCPKANLKKITKLFKDNNISLFGVVAREVQTQEAATSNEYLKQIISNMIDDNEVKIEK